MLFLRHFLSFFLFGIFIPLPSLFLSLSQIVARCRQKKKEVRGDLETNDRLLSLSLSLSLSLENKARRRHGGREDDDDDGAKKRSTKSPKGTKKVFDKEDDLLCFQRDY